MLIGLWFSGGIWKFKWNKSKMCFVKVYNDLEHHPLLRDKHWSSNQKYPKWISKSSYRDYEQINGIPCNKYGIPRVPRVNDVYFFIIEMWRFVFLFHSVNIWNYPFRYFFQSLKIYLVRFHSGSFSKIDQSVNCLFN